MIARQTINWSREDTTETISPKQRQIGWLVACGQFDVAAKLAADDPPTDTEGAPSHAASRPDVEEAAPADRSTRVGEGCA